VKKEKAYALEMTAVFVSGLGMMMIISVTVWLVSMFILGSRELTQEVLGDTKTISQLDSGKDFYNQVALGAGQVAGVTDDSSVDENEVRNALAVWLTSVREVQGLKIAYRDPVLDRNAQNHARTMAQACDSGLYSDWSEYIGTKVSEGYITSFSESAFEISGATRIAEEMPLGTVAYSRLFTNYDAYGIGVVDVREYGCGYNYITVLHLAEVK
jgi:hypothetical protein